APLGEVEAVADLAPDAVVFLPLDETGVHAALQDEVFDEAADGVVGKGGDHRCAEAKAAAQPAGHVVLATAFPGGKLAGGVDATFSRVEAQHHFAHGDAVKGGFFGRSNGQGHGVVRMGGGWRVEDSSLKGIGLDVVR